VNRSRDIFVNLPPLADGRCQIGRIVVGQPAQARATSMPPLLMLRLVATQCSASAWLILNHRDNLAAGD
jgi:hypothetical protein